MFRPKTRTGMLSGIFKPSTKPTEGSDSLSVGGELWVSTRDPINHSVTSENSGFLSSFFRRSPKSSPKLQHKQENAPVLSEPSAREETPTNQTSSGVFGWIFRNPFSSSAQETEKSDSPGDTHSEHTQMSVSSDAKNSEGTADEKPTVPPRPTEEELSATITYRLNQLQPTDYSQTDVPQEDREEAVETAGGAYIEGLQQKDRNEESADKNELPKKKVKKKKNPFMPHVTGKVVRKKGGAGAECEQSDGQKKSLMEQLNELRLERAQKEEEEDLEDLMEWWSTVQQWEPMPKEDDMTEKEEARAFAVTAEKIQRGIRVFHKLFSERAEGLWQHIVDLRAIADGLDQFNWRTKVAQITGGSTSAIGGVTTITGLALAPVTMGTSLVVTAVGLGVAAAGGLTSASAGISNAVNTSMDRKKVERIVEDYQSKMADINKCTKFIRQGVENLRQFNLLRVKKQAYNCDFPGLGAIYEDGAMAGKAVLSNANEIMRVVQVANVAGSTAGRAVQIASTATGVLSGLFLAMDVYFIAKDSQELHKGAKSEFATKIREVAEKLHQGLVELNSIRDELQSSGTNPGEPTRPAPSTTEENPEKINLCLN